MQTKPVILCVDDEKVILDSLSSQIRMANSQNYIVELATGVDEAWEIMEELRDAGQDLRLIISDWLMPPHRGDQFLTEVYRQWPDVKLVMLSGQADEDATERVKRLPTLLAFVRKPWEKEEILSLVSQACGEARA